MSQRSRTRATKLGRPRKKPLMKFIEAGAAWSMLTGVSFAGNFAQPDLNLSRILAQSVQAGQTLNINLVAPLAMVTDLNDQGQPTGDVIRYQLDPDAAETPATISAAGILTWTPTADQVGQKTLIVIAIDAGTPHLADAETLVITVLPPPANVSPVVDLNAPGSGH